MSGGRWQYVQFRLDEVIEDLTTAIEKNGLKKEPDELDSYDKRYMKQYPELAYHDKYSDEAIQKFKEARLAIAVAQEHIQRIDWYLCGDDGEESYIEILKENLDKIKEEYKV